MLAQIRLGILPLNIEVGRYRNQPLEERLCPICELQEVEDEFHFLFQCPNNELLRNSWFIEIRNRVPDIDFFDGQEQLRIIFENCHRLASKFIKRSFDLRKEKLFNV